MIRRAFSSFSLFPNPVLDLHRVFVFGKGKRMYIVRQLYQNQMTEVPKRVTSRSQRGRSKVYGWAYLCHEKEYGAVKPVRTYQSFFQVAAQMTHYTPNTFYRSDRRSVETLRWLNALCFDVDVKNGANEGLPRPSLVIRTPSGGITCIIFLRSPCVQPHALSSCMWIYKGK
ncbi:hypothetical protein JQN58_17925 [Aneurinibacillus sp. BA2021]|nr:hypothetical protein [Aneurinibacillus sp. BA2021]